MELLKELRNSQSMVKSSLGTSCLLVLTEFWTKGGMCISRRFLLHQKQSLYKAEGRKRRQKNKDICLEPPG